MFRYYELHIFYVSKPFCCMSRTTENFRLKKTLDINIDCCQDLISLVFICLLDGGRLGLSVCLFFVDVCFFHVFSCLFVRGLAIGIVCLFVYLFVCLFLCLFVVCLSEVGQLTMSKLFNRQPRQDLFLAIFARHRFTLMDTGANNCFFRF